MIIIISCVFLISCLFYVLLQQHIYNLSSYENEYINKK